MLYESITKEKVYDKYDPYSKKNEALFQFAEDVIQCATLSKLDYYFCGGISFMLYFGKSYRPLNDLDFKINPKELKTWKQFFELQSLGPRKCRYVNLTTENAIPRYKIYWDSNGEKCAAEIFLTFDKSESTAININNQSINVTHPQAMINTKSKYSREKDYLDIEYYGLSQYKPE
jgi:hypothetical protein